LSQRETEIPSIEAAILSTKSDEGQARRAYFVVAHLLFIMVILLVMREVRTALPSRWRHNSIRRSKRSIQSGPPF
jgi:hypothetical protein